jgi:hypothetical protein
MTTGAGAFPEVTLDEDAWRYGGASRAGGGVTSLCRDCAA